MSQNPRTESPLEHIKAWRESKVFLILHLSPVLFPFSYHQRLSILQCTMKNIMAWSFRILLLTANAEINWFIFPSLSPPTPLPPFRFPYLYFEISLPKFQNMCETDFSAQLGSGSHPELTKQWWVAGSKVLSARSFLGKWLFLLNWKDRGTINGKRSSQ